MGGLDKGLQHYQGRPLAAWALDRLAPQVGPLLLSANRHLGDYAALGVPVLTDDLPGHAGPMAGLLAGLSACTTPWLLCVPCDSPAFPLDLAARLAAGLQAAAAPLAAACTPAEGEDAAPHRHPVFCLMSTAVLPSLHAFMASGQRKLDLWQAQQGRVLVTFDDPSAFRNLNTMDDLRAFDAEPAAPR